MFFKSFALNIRFEWLIARLTPQSVGFYAGLLFFLVSVPCFWDVAASAGDESPSTTIPASSEASGGDSTTPAATTDSSLNPRATVPIATVESLLEKIQSDSYASREIAYELLLLNPEGSIRLIEDSLPKMDHDAATRLIRILASWATRPDAGFGLVAWETLQRIAVGGVTTNSQLARFHSTAIALEQSEIAAKRLQNLSAFIGVEPIQVVTAAKLDLCILRIDERFRGTADDLIAARWLIEPKLVRLEGERINREWLEKIISMPSVQIVQLKHTSLNADDLQLLREMKTLDTLELLYMPIDDTSLESLATLPIWGSLRIFGTKITPEAIPRLESLLEGTQVIFGLGGFLGIQSNSLTLEVSEVNPGSGADKGGMLRGDRILSIDGKSLENFEALRKELGKSSAGAEVVIEVRRYERELGEYGVRRTPVDVKLAITLGEQ